MTDVLVFKTFHDVIVRRFAKDHSTPVPGGTEIPCTTVFGYEGSGKCHYRVTEDCAPFLKGDILVDVPVSKTVYCSDTFIRTNVNTTRFRKSAQLNNAEPIESTLRVNRRGDEITAQLHLDGDRDCWVSLDHETLKALVEAYNHTREEIKTRPSL